MSPMLETMQVSYTGIHASGSPFIHCSYSSQAAVCTRLHRTAEAYRTEQPGYGVLLAAG